jgi:elongation factor G
MAFKIAGSEAFKIAFLKAAPVLLEPTMSIEITAPEENVGDVVGDICSRRGKVLGMEIKGKQQIISAEAPLSEMFGYATALRSLTSGRATYSMHFEKYTEVPYELAEKLTEEARLKKEAGR